MSANSARILVVDDDAVMRDFLRHVLETGGHHVDSASDGYEAVERIRGARYDVALVDYHMPELDGIAAARLVAAAAGRTNRPALVGLTADSGGLAQREASKTTFQAIVSKPVDPATLLTSIAALRGQVPRNEARAIAAARWRALGLAGAPKALFVPGPTVRPPAGFANVFDWVRDIGDADVLLLTSAHSEALTIRGRAAEAASIPAFDVTGALTEFTDGSFDPAIEEDWSRLAKTVTAFAARRPALAANDLRDSVLVYLAASGRVLAPLRSASSRSFVKYAGLFDDEALIATAESLANEGAVARRFADRFHVCGECTSHRMNAREECPACRSPNLAETPLLHHYACAWVAPDADFREGDTLRCPKCRQAPRFYGSDYERAGSALTCRDCGALATDPSVGFVCIDCGAHADGEAVQTRDVFAYSLTRAGLRAVSPVPPSEGVVLAEISYGGRERLVGSRGALVFATLRGLFIENLRTLVAEVGEVIPGDQTDLLRLEDVDPEDLLRHAGTILDRCQSTLAEPIGASIAVLPGEEAAHR